MTQLLKLVVAVAETSLLPIITVSALRRSQPTNEKAAGAPTRVLEQSSTIKTRRSTVPFDQTKSDPPGMVIPAPPLKTSAMSDADVTVAKLTMELDVDELITDWLHTTRLVLDTALIKSNEIVLMTTGYSTDPAAMTTLRSSTALVTREKRRKAMYVLEADAAGESSTVELLRDIASVWTVPRL